MNKLLYLCSRKTTNAFMENNYPFISMLRKYVSSSVLLVIATIAALIIANSPWGDLYRSFWELPVSLSLGSFNLFSHNGHATQPSLALP